MSRNFDIDELTVLEMFEEGSRDECLQNMRDSLSELEDDPEMQDLVMAVIEKLDDMSDSEYLEIEYYDAVADNDGYDAEGAADEYDLYMETYIYSDDRRHTPVDFMWVAPDDDWLLAGGGM